MLMVEAALLKPIRKVRTFVSVEVAKMWEDIFLGGKMGS